MYSCKHDDKVQQGLLVLLFFALVLVLKTCKSKLMGPAHGADQGRCQAVPSTSQKLHQAALLQGYFSDSV
jgi:hypothetical protein